MMRTKRAIVAIIAVVVSAFASSAIGANAKPQRILPDQVGLVQLKNDAIRLKSGTTITGFMTSRRADSITIRISDGVTTTIPKAATTLIEQHNPNLDLTKLPVLIMLVLFGAFFVMLQRRARSVRGLGLRRLPGIDAIEEAIGRATEMGRPVLFIPGLNDIDDIQTLAGLSILSHVAYIAAEYDTPVIVACRRSVVLTMAEETVKEASLAAGRPDVFIPNNMRYLSDDQFAFTAGVNGIMLRERPASAIYMGCFYSESLILAETGFVSGAIQVAGTANVAQLPFFVAACDYTLLGEEFFAASAYLSKEPPILASIVAADWLKMIMLLAIVLGVILATLVATGVAGADFAWFLQLLKEVF